VTFFTCVATGAVGEGLPKHRPHDRTTARLHSVYDCTDDSTLPFRRSTARPHSAITDNH